MEISICIPKMNRNTKKSQIKQIFNYHNFGTIKNIDLILLGKIKGHLFIILLGIIMKKV